MSAKNKVRGNIAETYIVKMAEEYGIDAQRAWASDGRSMGLCYKDDGTIGPYRWQSKRFMFKNVVKWFIRNAIDYLQGDQELITFYIDRSKGRPRQVYTIMELEEFFKLLKKAEEKDEC